MAVYQTHHLFAHESAIWEELLGKDASLFHSGRASTEENPIPGRWTCLGVFHWRVWWLGCEGWKTGLGRDCQPEQPTRGLPMGLGLPHGMVAPKSSGFLEQPDARKVRIPVYREEAERPFYDLALEVTCSHFRCYSIIWNSPKAIQTQAAVA